MRVDLLRTNADLQGLLGQVAGQRRFWAAVGRELAAHGVTDFSYAATCMPRAVMAGVPGAIDQFFASFDSLPMDRLEHHLQADLTTQRVLKLGAETLWHDDSLWEEATPAQIAMAERERDIGLDQGITVICRYEARAVSGMGLGFSGLSRGGFDRHWPELEHRLRPLVALIDQMTWSDHIPRRIALTPRERDCLAWLAGGLRPDEIAGRLMISYSTVDKHITAARIKLGARTRDQAVARALNLGLITA